MKTLPAWLADQLTISQKAYGLQRAPQAALGELRSATLKMEGNASDLYAAVDLIVAAVECGLRSGSTPFALAQALTNRQTEAANKRYPPPLNQFKLEVKIDRQGPHTVAADKFDDAKIAIDPATGEDKHDDAFYAELGRKHAENLKAATRESEEKRFADVMNSDIEKPA